MIATLKREAAEVCAGGLARANARRGDWREGMATKGDAREAWRRVSGITKDNEGELDSRELKFAYRRLVKWIEKFVLRSRVAGELGGARKAEVAVGWADSFGDPYGSCAIALARPQTDEAEPVASGLADSLGSAGGSRAIALAKPRTAAAEPVAPDHFPSGEKGEEPSEGGGMFGRLAPHPAWPNGGPRRPSPQRGEGIVAAACEGWAAVGTTSGEVERLVLRLGLSEQRLTGMTRAFANVTARELVDGVLLKDVRGEFLERAKEAARELWGSPGTRTYLRVMDGELKITKPAGIYCVWPTEKFVRQEIYAERKRRCEELFAAFEASWKNGDADRDGFALKLGFASFAKFRRAMLNVKGESPRQMAWRLCCQVVEYYLAAEAKVLRELACSVLESEQHIRARWLYSGKTERCVPAGDYWDAMEFGQPAFLAEMMAVLGRPL